MDIPILFSGSMPMAVTNGLKTQTRRIIKPQPPCTRGGAPWASVEDLLAKCRYGKRGDTMVGLSTWATSYRFDHLKPSDLPVSVKIWTAFDGEKPAWAGKNRPGRFMPLFLREHMPHRTILDIRVQRLRDITREEAIAEGVTTLPGQDPDEKSAWWETAPGKHQARTPQKSFRLLWDDINASGGYPWEKNPAVFAITFEPDDCRD